MKPMDAVESALLLVTRQCFEHSSLKPGEVVVVRYDVTDDISVEARRTGKEKITVTIKGAMFIQD